MDEWNNLPSEAVMVNTVNRFKAKIDPLKRQVGAPNETAKTYCPDPEPPTSNLLKLVKIRKTIQSVFWTKQFFPDRF